ncbi:hypothetical protein [Imperialibacter roseus]|uniref:Uncharacterized protein n=1 Tax=Imperialibacter roseus TaxID=1324217 RepID=A0ABZ0IQP3_9BACT|nr:hypothetical protein [Imperialibacter roseus]WOK06036.1 hypothetical protein RT717_23450 [Imperialibacter roseus]|tara:strand:+ start:115783 stop:116004 length:222 start_codon:yes stop_codon:yes gene_type:complete
MASNTAPTILYITRLEELSLRLEEIAAKDLNDIAKVKKKALQREVKSLKVGLLSRLLVAITSLDTFQIDEWPL